MDHGPLLTFQSLKPPLVLRSTQALMASSNKTYDIFLHYPRCESLSAARLAHGMRRRGIRPWFDRWSAIPGEPDAQAAFAMSASLILARIMGASGIPWASESEWIIDRQGTIATIVILL